MTLLNLGRGFRLSMLAAVVCASAVFAQSPAPAVPAGPGAGQAGQPPAPGGRGQGRGPAFPPVVIGPPAPVPPEVALPTAAEVTQMNDALAKFITSDKSTTAPLLKRYEHVVLLPPFRVNTAATYTQTVQRMGPRHEGFVERAKQGNIDLLLHGDSITDWWVQNDENKAMFDKYFANIKTANFAVAGDTTQGVLWGLHNGEGQGFQPKAVMLMIGTNNSGGSTAPEIAAGIGAVILEMRQQFSGREDSAARDLPARPSRRRRPRQDRASEQAHRAARRPEARVLPGHRAEVSGRERGLPSRCVQARQPAPAGEGL